ncbi:hypothetical protein ATL41_0376 [Flavimobilis soli]|uniref:Secreted protein n=1 Tax=Flavimobilis soli TaxID=442709 RepID=A0A2A9EAT8_9MICO|nr:hypothetical protein [Flavimobilis soli]PFG35681.1 hypothetical protein ATL41_0376 [Flavimobilis soli]
MTWSEVVVILVAIITIGVVVAWQAATRLDRLHRKVVASRIALDAQLVRRAGAAHALATSGVIDPVSALVLADAVIATDAAQGDRELLVAVPDLAELVDERSRRGADVEGELVHGAAPPRVIGEALAEGLGEVRTHAESNLSAALRAVLADSDEVAELRSTVEGAEILDDLASAWYRVQLARRFHNEAVAQAQRVRAKRGVRVLRLAGRAAMPEMVEFDDVWPAELPRPGRGAVSAGR